MILTEVVGCKIKLSGDEVTTFEAQISRSTLPALPLLMCAHVHQFIKPPVEPESMQKLTPCRSMQENSR